MNNHQTITDYYKAQREELLNFVNSRLGGNQQEAEDIVQDVFFRLLSSDKMITEVTLPCLTYTIARHLITDYYRRHHVAETYEHFLMGADRQAESAESVLSVRMITERMEHGLARVPENCREIYRMHIYGGMKVSEISSRLGEGYKSVEHRLGVARKAVRQYLCQVI